MKSSPNRKLEAKIIEKKIATGGRRGHPSSDGMEQPRRMKASK
jgi:hypothetical protein